jgi:hypothetical protein
MPGSDDKFDDFYVGYRKKMPTGLARFIVPTVVSLLLGVALLAVIVPALHNAYDDARSDFRDMREFEGIFVARPAPHLVVVRPGVTDTAAFSRYVMVGRGKSGPKIDVEALHGKHVKVMGSLIYNKDGETLLSVRSAEAVMPTEPAPSDPTAMRAVGNFTLQGEIIDSKCYFGTMRPGHTAVHRGCAIRCIAGGVPPVFLTRDQQGNTMTFLLADADGGSVNQQVLPFVADPLEITGEVLRMDDVFVLKADPATYRRL